MARPKKIITDGSPEIISASLSVYYDSSRIIKLSTMIHDLRRFAAVGGNAFSNESYDQHVILSHKCQSALVQAMEAFPSYSDLRAQDGVYEQLTRDVVPQALSHPGYSEDQYTAVSNWVCAALESIPGQTRDNRPDEIVRLGKLLQKISGLYGDFVARDKLYPRFFDGAHFRSHYLFATCFPQRMKDQARLIGEESLGSDTRLTQWMSALNEYRKQNLRGFLALQALMRNDLANFSYKDSKPLRGYLMRSLVPSDNECADRASKILHALGRGESCRPGNVESMLETISVNQDFYKNTFPDHVLMSVSDLTTVDPAATETKTIDVVALNQLCSLISKAGITTHQMLSIALTNIAGIDQSVVSSVRELPDTQKAVIIMQAYQSAAQTHFTPSESEHDALLYLLLKDAPHKVVEAAATVNDSSATIAYLITGDGALLKGLKDSRHGDHLLGVDLGL